MKKSTKVVLLGMIFIGVILSVMAQSVFFASILTVAVMVIIPFEELPETN